MEADGLRLDQHLVLIVDHHGLDGMPTTGHVYQLDARTINPVDVLAILAIGCQLDGMAGLKSGLQLHINRDIAIVRSHSFLTGRTDNRE